MSPPPEPEAPPEPTLPFRAAGEGSPRRLPSKRFSRDRADALGYVTVPAVDDAHREELRRQVKRIRRACDAFELSLLELIPDDESTAPTPTDRAGYRRVMRRLDRGDAACLVTTRVQRVASSAEEWVLLLDLLDELEVRLIVVDDALDTGSASGRDEAWRLAGLEAPLTPGAR
jgi:DNA invertase Pin-like site-specific DNA recombinase